MIEYKIFDKNQFTKKETQITERRKKYVEKSFSTFRKNNTLEHIKR
jgi:hypothetical protein